MARGCRIGVWAEMSRYFAVTADFLSVETARQSSEGLTGCRLVTLDAEDISA